MMKSSVYVSKADTKSQFDTRGAIAQALQSLVNLDQVAAFTLDILAHHFQGAEIGLALALKADQKLAPVWSTGGEEALLFRNSSGRLWEKAEMSFEAAKAGRTIPKKASMIHSGDNILGVLVFLQGDNRLSGLVDFIAGELGQASSQLEKIAEAQRLNREQAILHSVVKSLTSSLEMDAILTATMQGIWELFHIESGALFLLNYEKQNSLVKIPLIGEINQRIDLSLDPKRGIAGHCIANMATMLVDDVSTNRYYESEIDSVGSQATKSLLCIPLLVSERVIGAIELINKIDGSFTRHDLKILVTLGASIAAALENSRLFRELTDAYTDLEASRREISHSRTTLLTLVNNLDDELYIVDRNYRVVAANRASADRAGKQAEKLVGKRCYEVLAGRKKPCHGCLASETFDTGGKTKRIEREWKEGKLKAEREIYTYPIMDGQGNVPQTILQNRDVTEQRKLEASLVQSEKLAAVGELAAGVAHELNNPITAIIGNVQLMQREITPDKEQLESLELIEQAGRRAQKVVGDLLNFARQESQKFVIVDVNNSIQQALALIQLQWPKSDVHLEILLDDDIPQVHGNPDHLQSVWLNLLLNARDALEDKKGKVTIQSFRSDDQVTVQVSDNGIGISAENLQKVFEPFFTTKAPGRGTGLGLPTSYRIIKQHSGTIQVESVLKRGTTVTVKLPAASVSLS